MYPFFELMTRYHFTESEKTWDCIAKSFNATRRKPWTQVIDFVNTLSSSDMVADIGCGNGRHLVVCVEKGINIVGVDISTNLLSLAQSKVSSQQSSVAFVQGDLAHIPLKDERFDAVLYIAALHIIKGRTNRTQSLQELHRILKSEGKALVSVWSREQERFRDCFGDKKKSDGELGDIEIYWRQHNLQVPRFYHLYSKDEFIEDIEKSGLQIETITDAKIKSKQYPDNYFAVVRKR